jgi:hypothetical protein
MKVAHTIPPTRCNHTKLASEDRACVAYERAGRSNSSCRTYRRQRLSDEIKGVTKTSQDRLTTYSDVGYLVKRKVVEHKPEA